MPRTGGGTGGMDGAGESWVGRHRPSPRDAGKVLDMKTRLAGLVLLACGLLAAALFLYVPHPDGTLAPLGPAHFKGLVFVGFAVVIGLAFVLGGAPVLAAFQARPKSREQLMLVLALIVASGTVAALAYWQMTRHGRPRPPATILDTVPAGPPALVPR